MTGPGQTRGAYLSDTAPRGVAGRHGGAPDPVGGAVALRAKIMLHLLFTDRLVVGDAQALTNPTLRALLWPGDEFPGCPADLAALLHSGNLLVAKRDSEESLRTLRDWEAEHEVEHTPSAEYAELLDAETEGRLLTYGSADVSETFRLGVIDQLTDLADASPPHEAATITEVRDWVRSRETFLYNDFRKWRRGRPEERLLDRVDRFIAIPYALSLPRSLALDYVGPVDPNSLFTVVKLAERDGYPLGDYGVDEKSPEGRACYCVNTTVLGQLPVDFVLEAMQMSERAELLAELRKPREGRDLDWDRVVGSFGAMMDALNGATIHYLQEHRLEDALALLRTDPPQWRLNLSRNFLTQTVADVGMSVVTGGENSVGQMLAKMTLFGGAVATEVVTGHRAELQAWRAKRDGELRRLLSSADADERLVRTPRSGLRRFEASPELLGTGNV